MDASEALGLLSALNSAVEGLDRCFTSPRVLLRPNIGTLHFITIPGRSSLWGVVKRYPDQPEPFYALFEVEGDSEPNLVQEAHYTATRRLEAHYLAFAAPVLTALAHSEGVRTAPDCDGVEDFRTVSLRIPPNPFAGQTWKLRYRHRRLPHRIFELEYEAADLREAYVYEDLVAHIASGPSE